jgi:anthranilate synthase component 2
VVDAATIPDVLEVTALSDEGQVMALRHRDRDVRGIQFHPESVLTPDGRRMIENWLKH